LKAANEKKGDDHLWTVFLYKGLRIIAGKSKTLTPGEVDREKKRRKGQRKARGVAKEKKIYYFGETPKTNHIKKRTNINKRRRGKKTRKRTPIQRRGESPSSL